MADIYVTINGNTYSSGTDPATGFGNYGYIERFPSALADVVVVAGEVADDAADVAADKATVIADKAIVAADKATVAADKAIVIADKATVAADKAIVSADKATTLGYKNDAQTAATTASTQAGIATTKAGEASDDADQVAIDAAQVAADKITVAADKATVAADKAATLGYKNDAAASAAAAEDAADLFVAGQLRTVSATLTATGTTQTDALALTNEENICTTVASGTGVKLMAKPSTGGKIVYVMNLGANPLKVYPASGESFNALATNAEITLAVGGILEARSDTTTRWNVRTNQITDLISNGTLSLNNQNITGLKSLVMNTPETITTTTGAVTLDFSTGSLKLQNELTGAVTYTFTAPPQYSRIQIFFASDGTSTAYGITWPASVKWLGSAFTTTTANKAAMVNGFYDGTNYWMMGSSEA